MARAVAVAVGALGGPSLAAQPAPDTLTAGTVHVIHAQRHASLARETLDAAVRPFHLPGIGPTAVPESTVIILAPSPEAFSQATGGRAPHWAGGVAFPDARVIVLPAYPRPGVQRVDAAATLRHEVAHLALREFLPGPIPRWFDEGYAEIAAGRWDVEAAWTLRVAFLLGRAPDWDSLAFRWPREAERARLAYLLSATAVDHIRRRTGEQGFELLMRNWREMGDLEEAVRYTFGMTMGQLEEEWRRDVRRRYGWMQAAGSVAVLWLVAAILALIAWIPRRRRQRARIDVLRREEHMLPPPRAAGMEVDYPIAEAPPPEERLGPGPRRP